MTQTFTNPKTVIFDFDGTLADTLPIIINAINTFSPKYHYPKITSTEINLFRSLGARKFLKIHHFPLHRAIFIANDIRRHLSSGSYNPPPFPGIRDLLTTLKNLSCNLGIISSGAPKMIQDFLIKHQINFFDFICHNTFFSKVSVLSKVIRQQHLDSNSTFYIGDETGDIISAHKKHLTSVAVSWGYNSTELLKSVRPNYIVSQPEEILKILSL